METKKQAIRRLKKQGEKELYVVTVYIESNGQCTDIWNIYGSVEDAMRWVALCKAYYSINKSFKETSNLNFEGFESVCRNIGTDKATYSFMTGDEHNSLVHIFVFERS